MGFGLMALWSTIGLSLFTVDTLRGLGILLVYHGTCFGSVLSYKFIPYVVRGLMYIECAKQEDNRY